MGAALRNADGSRVRGRDGVQGRGMFMWAWDHHCGCPLSLYLRAIAGMTQEWLVSGFTALLVLMWVQIELS